MKVFGKISELVSSVFRKDGYEITLKPNSTAYTTNVTVQLPPDDTTAGMTLVGIDVPQTITAKTFSNSNVYALKDVNVTFEDDANSTKKFSFDASNIPSGTTKIFGVPDASTTLVGDDTSQTLTNKTIESSTIDGDLNTIQDVALSSLKADATNDDEFLYRSPTTGTVSSTSVNELTEKTSNTGDDDFFLIWDSTAGAHKKITRENFPGGRGGYARVFMNS